MHLASFRCAMHLGSSPFGPEVALWSGLVGFGTWKTQLHSVTRVYRAQEQIFQSPLADLPLALAINSFKFCLSFTTLTNCPTRTRETREALSWVLRVNVELWNPG